MELNQEAWNQWELYRTGIKKPIKSASAEAMKLKLMRFGKDQQAVVDQSISNGWQGLFAITPDKPDPTAPKTRTPAQEAAAQAAFEHANRENQKGWDSQLASPLKYLRLADCLLARYDVDPNQHSIALAEKRSWLKDRVASLLREANPAAVLADYHLWRLVLRLFSDAGLRRLEEKAKALEQARAA